MHLLDVKDADLMTSAFDAVTVSVCHFLVTL